MNLLQLKSYIPIGGALTWIPTDGNEPNMRFVPGFDLQWYHTRLGIDFSESWHMDANLRYKATHKMKRYINGVFPGFQEFELKYNGDVEESCAAISGVHGVMLIHKIYGGKVLYRAGGWPDAPPDIYITHEEIRSLKPFDLDNNPVVQNLLSQMDVLQERYGIVYGYLNYQGVLNTAFRLRGTNIFSDMIDEPELADALFSHISQTTRALALMVQKRQRESGFCVNLIGSSNCVLNMISPKMYEDMLFKYDYFLSTAFERYAVHTCNWDITPYIEVLRKLPHVGYIDMGADSDYEKVRATFPHARGNVLMSPVVMKKTRLERSRMVDRIADIMVPCDISMGSIDTSVPDEEIVWMHDYIANHRINK